MNENIYTIGKQLGLRRKDINNIIATDLYPPIKSINTSESELYKYGAWYATISHKDLYKAGTKYGTLNAKDVYKDGALYGTISPKELYKDGSFYGTISPRDFQY